MRYHWLKDREQQQQFYIYWDKGSNNHGDYWTKHFSPTYHQDIRSTYILKGFYVTIPKYNINNVCTRVCSSPDSYLCTHDVTDQDYLYKNSLDTSMVQSQLPNIQIMALNLQRNIDSS